jgi:hypothetical protein
MPSAMPSARHVCSNLRVVVLQRPLFVFLGIVHIAPFLLHPRIFNGERAVIEQGRLVNVGPVQQGRRAERLAQKLLHRAQPAAPAVLE